MTNPLKRTFSTACPRQDTPSRAIIRFFGAGGVLFFAFAVLVHLDLHRPTLAAYSLAGLLVSIFLCWRFREPPARGKWGDTGSR
jgi:hypothetical protein